MSAGINERLFLNFPNHYLMNAFWGSVNKVNFFLGMKHLYREFLRKNIVSIFYLSILVRTLDKLFKFYKRKQHLVHKGSFLIIIKNFNNEEWTMTIKGHFGYF